MRFNSIVDNVFCLCVHADRDVLHSVCMWTPTFAHNDEFCRKCEASQLRYKQQSVTREESAESV